MTTSGICDKLTRADEMLKPSVMLKPIEVATFDQYGTRSFVHMDEVTEEDIRLAQEGLARALQAMCSGDYAIVVLDEINVALYFHLIAVQDVLGLIDQKPPTVELVLTGRRVPDEILARADYVTDMQEVRHPYQRGISARKGIEH